jgi:PAS domain S-box-containing protein
MGQGTTLKTRNLRRIAGRIHAGASETRAPLVALAAVDDRFRAIFDLVQDGIFITDPSTSRFIEVNRAGCAMVGYAKAEIIGQDIAFLSSGVHPYTLDVAIETSNNAALGETKMLDWRIRKKDGSLFWAEISKHYTKIGHLPVNISTVRDISGRKRMEQKLLVALSDAAAASDAKSAFLANVSHELRTPLNAVIGFSELILRQPEGPVAPKYCEYLDDIHSSGLRLLALINEVLNLSRLEAGTVVLDEQNIALGHVIIDACRMMGDQALRSGLEIKIEVAPDLAQVGGDERRLRQILLNLLSNALKFTAGPGMISVRARNMAGSICCEVSDTGIGIAEADLPKVMERFGQIENKFSRKHQAAGLGLPLVKELVELHGGSVTIESQEGKGTRVAFCLPVTAAIKGREHR